MCDFCAGVFRIRSKEILNTRLINSPYDSPTLASHARMCSNAAADVNNALHSPEGDVKHTVTVNYGPYMN